MKGLFHVGHTGEAALLQLVQYALRSTVGFTTMYKLYYYTYLLY